MNCSRRCCWRSARSRNSWYLCCRSRVGLPTSCLSVASLAGGIAIDASDPVPRVHRGRLRDVLRTCWRCIRALEGNVQQWPLRPSCPTLAIPPSKAVCDGQADEPWRSASRSPSRWSSRWRWRSAAATDSSERGTGVVRLGHIAAACRPGRLPDRRCTPGTTINVGAAQVCVARARRRRSAYLAPSDLVSDLPALSISSQ